MFPTFSYDARTGNLVDETLATRQAFSGMLVGVAWGMAVAIFVEPLCVGVVSASHCWLSRVSESSTKNIIIRQSCMIKL